MTAVLGIAKSPLMFITDSSRSRGRSNPEVIRRVLEGGGRWIQYREPDLSDRDFYNECVRIREICDQVGAGLIVNDRLDIAALVRADGVHLGKNDLPVKVVKEYMGNDFLVGYSAHSLEEAITVEWEGADYLTFSPIFQLKHKSSPFKPHGIDGARKVIDKIKAPVFLLGGISFDNLEQLAVEIPECRIAVVSMLSEADDIAASTEKALEVLSRGKKKSL